MRISAPTLAVVLAALLALAGATTATAATLDIVVARMSAQEAADQAVAALAAAIRAQRPQIGVTVGPTPEAPQVAIQRVRAGTAAIALVPLSVLGTPSAQSLEQPWQFTSHDGMRQALSSEIGALARAEFERSGVLVLGLWNLAFRRVGARVEIADLGALKGRKILAGPPTGQSALVMAQVGASPQSVAFAEAYTVLQQGVADAAVVVSDPSFQRAGYIEVLGNYVEQPYQPVVAALVINREVWHKILDFPEQIALADAARDAERAVQSLVETQDLAFRDYVSSRGGKIRPLAEQDIAIATKASYQALATTARGDAAELLEIAATAARSPPLPAPPSGDVRGEERNVLFATDRALVDPSQPRLAFGKQGDRLTFGQAWVRLRPGSESDPEFEKDATVTSVEPMASATAFQARLREATSNPATPVIVFVHGYHNGFTDAVTRSASIARNGSPPAVVISFSWGSDGGIFAYGYDEEAVIIANERFRSFMAALDGVLDRRRVSVLAHSMGSRILVDYFDWADGRPEFQGVARLANLVFAASDVTQELFGQRKEKLARAASRATIYVSENDKALYFSEKLHDRGRLGRAPVQRLFIDKAMDTVNASEIDKTVYFVDFAVAARHSYVFDKPHGIADLGALLAGKAPDARSSIVRKQRGADVYWQLAP